MSTIKTRDIEAVIRNMGFERGVKHVITTQNEMIRQLNKDLTECANQMSAIIDTLAKVVEGAGAMKQNFEHQMRKLGGIESKDDMNPNTQDL